MYGKNTYKLHLYGKMPELIDFNLIDFLIQKTHIQFYFETSVARTHSIY